MVLSFFLQPVAELALEVEKNTPLQWAERLMNPAEMVGWVGLVTLRHMLQVST